MSRGIKYTYVDNHIVLTNVEKKQEKKIVTGQITDANTNEALPGVTILEKGTANGTITDLNGNFSISVDQNGSLLISYVGYTAQEIAVSTIQGDLNVVMQPDVVSLNEIVVIGYGTVKKSDLTGAVASVSAEDLQRNMGSGIDQALQGKNCGCFCCIQFRHTGSFTHYPHQGCWYNR
ncbi:MAG: hypothetical protein HC906_08365 [Bacteroidales bacterium]|nr:hypothetical protein [Bacteroidales bacterium]